MEQTRTTSRRIVAGLAALVALGVLLQSVWAGGFLRAFYSDAGAVGGARALHELGANATFGLLVVEGLVVLVTSPLRRDRLLLGSGLLLGLLLTGVIGLGYVGGGSVAVHVPLAVATFGVALWHAAAAARGGPDPDRPDATQR
jgi:hypothetical protein